MEWVVIDGGGWGKGPELAHARTYCAAAEGPASVEDETREIGKKIAKLRALD